MIRHDDADFAERRPRPHVGTSKVVHPNATVMVSTDVHLSSALVRAVLAS